MKSFAQLYLYINIIVQKYINNFMSDNYLSLIKFLMNTIGLNTIKKQFYWQLNFVF